MLLSFQPSLLTVPAQPGTLLYRHPEYEKRRWWREFNRISYLGGREYLEPSMISTEFRTIEQTGDPNTAPVDTASTVTTTRYNSMLYRHPREKLYEFANRHRRAYYQNIVRSTVNMLVSHSLKRPVTRKGDQLALDFWNGVDRDGQQSMDAFMRHGLRWAQVMGIMWACVDSTDGADGKPPRPYVYWVSPLDIFDWEVDDYGKIVWLKQFVYVEQARDDWKSPVMPRYRWRIWTRTGVQTFETDTTGGGEKLVPEMTRDYNLVGEDGEAVVPFVPLFSMKDADYTFPDGTPLAGDLCKGANHIFNLGSLLSEILYKQTFSWLVIPDKNVDFLQMGVNTAFGYDGTQTTASPMFISPDADQARVMMEAAGNTLEQLRQSIGVGRGRSESSKQQASADALELESEDKKSILGDIVSEAEDCERRIMTVFDMWRTSPTEEKASVRYSREFDINALMADLDEILSFKEVGVSPEVNLEMVRQAVRRKFSGLEPDELEKLVATLKPPPPPQAFGLPGQPKVGPDGKPLPPQPGAAPAGADIPVNPFSDRTGALKAQMRQAARAALKAA